MRLIIIFIRLGRFESIQLWDKDNSKETPRFTITVVDAYSSEAHLCAVFFIPPGRQCEFTFSTYDGLRSIAKQAGCNRLLAVTCNQPHYFPPLTSPELQNELTPIVLTLKPRLESKNKSDEKMNFIAIQSDNDWNTIKAGMTAMSGSYVVEESPDDDIDGAMLRRLIFLQNQNFIQTEIRIVPKSATKTNSNSNNNKKNKKKTKSNSNNNNNNNNNNKSTSTAEYDYDYSYSDDIYLSTLLSFLLSPKIIANGTRNVNSNTNTKQELERILSSARHDVVFNFPPGTLNQQDYVPKGLIVGLGGGN